MNIQTVVGSTRRGLSLAVVATGVTLVLVLAGCTEASPPMPSTPTTSTPAPAKGAAQATGTPTTISDRLKSPWSVVFSGSSALISERDTAIVKERTESGEVREVGRVAGVVAAGEGGLLGLATLRETTRTWLYAYTTTAVDNRIVRMPLLGPAGAFALGQPEPVLIGLAKANNHDGGRIAFGPDGLLYATVGDASVPARAQDLTSLNGKILRMTATGGVPRDNPFPGSLVYSLGHRNPQGIAWDASGQLWASEFGQNTWDEFNKIVAGKNYGWPTVEGTSTDPRFVNPVVQWATSDASPSGLTFAQGTFFLAALKGERIYALNPDASGTIAAVPFYAGRYGRLRDVAAAPDGTLWILTNNTDGRGNPRSGDDRILRVQLAPKA